MGGASIRSNRPGLAFVTAIAVVLTLAVPFAGQALADHPSTCNLEVLEEVDSNPAGTTHTLTARLFVGTTGNSASCDQHAVPIEIDFEVESGPAIRACTPSLTTDECLPGPGQPGAGTAVGNEEGNTPQQPDFSCTISAAPTGDFEAQTRCTVHITSDATGTNQIRAWIDHDGGPGVDADTAEGRYAGTTDCTATDANARTTTDRTGPNSCTQDENGEAIPAVPGSSSEPDITDVVQKTWTQSVAGAVCVDLDPNDDVNLSGTEHTMTLTVTNQAARAASTSEDASEDTCFGAGTLPRAGVAAQFQLTDDDPNAFFTSVNGQPTNASGGTPNTVTCTTTAQGTCTATIKTVNPAAVDDNKVTATVVGSTAGTSQSETVTKRWASPQTVTNIDLVPEEDTNPLGTAHQLTATARNAVDQGVANTLITFEVVSGVNQSRDNDNNVATPPGFIGQCTTAASGSCSVSYTGTVLGDDVIAACKDDPADFECAGTEADSGNTRLGDADDDLVLKRWVSSGQGPAAISLDMEGCNGELANPSAATWEATAIPNGVSNDRQQAHAICAAVFSSANVLTRTRVTFTIVAGPGRFIVPSTASSTFTEGSNRDLGTTVTTEAGTCHAGATNAGAPTSGTGVGSGSYNCAFLLSQATGNTSVRACIEGTLICKTGTKPWTGESPARHISVTPETGSNMIGTNHEVIAKLTDRFGNAVANETITWSRTGEGFIVSQETTTNVEGQAKLVIRSDVEGTTTVSATITNQTNCARAAGNPTGATAGTCTDTATKTWTTEPELQCSDEIDNDGDGRIDFPDDPGCADADDDDETDPPPAPRACRDRGPDANVVVGTSGPDVLNGSSGRDVMCGAGGDDVINGRGGADLIVGNGGDDEISGGSGKDNISGNAGNDIVSGNRDNDSVKGNGGNDALKGNAGVDTLAGGGGSDALQGGDHSDILKGGKGSDTLGGGAGNDALDGGAGRDRCAGNAGRDRIVRCE